MSEPHVLPLLLCRGRLGRKGSYRSKAREANREGLHLRPFFVVLAFTKKSPTNKNAISRSCGDGVCEQRSYCIHNILLFIIVRRPVFNQLVGTGYLIIKRLAFIDLSYRSLSDEFFLRLFQSANI